MASLAFGGACGTAPRATGEVSTSSRVEPGIAAAASGAALRVVVIDDAGIVPDGTAARVGLADAPESWPSGPFVRRAMGTFRAGRAEVVVDDVPRGRWAVVAFADLDGDGQLARTVLGLPREPIAYGNDAAPRFGPPPFEACRVAMPGGDGSNDLQTDAVVSVTLRFE